MTEQLESALLTTDNYDTNNENNIQEFNSCTIYLDGKASIVTLGVELQKAAKAEKVALKWKAISVIILTFSLLGDIFAILLIEVLSEKTFGIILCVLSVMSTIVSSALCFISFKTKTSKHYFISQWRNGLKFDKTNKCIKEIQFQPDYGLNPNVSFDMKFINVHEPIIEEKEINIICAFDDVTDIGQTINRNNNGDIIGYQFYIGFENKKDSKWTANIVTGLTGAQRYNQLKDVMKHVNSNWLQEIEVNDSTD
eukprot:357473_1